MFNYAYSLLIILNFTAIFLRLFTFAIKNCNNNYYFAVAYIVLLSETVKAY